MVLKKVGVLSCGKVLGVLYGGLGLLMGAIFTLIAVLGAALGGGASNRPGGAIVGMIFGIGAVILVPIFYGVMGFIGGIITAAFYNAIAMVAGGLEVELE